MQRYEEGRRGKPKLLLLLFPTARAWIQFAKTFPRLLLHSLLSLFFAILIPPSPLPLMSPPRRNGGFFLGQEEEGKKKGGPHSQIVGQRRER